MKDHRSTIDVYLEIGSKRTFAGAVDWPGWVRSGRDEESALVALLEYAPRYAKILEAARISFESPADLVDFRINERLPGNPTTDFGAPNVPLSSDSGPFNEAEVLRLQSILKACWQALDAAAANARGVELRRGPRGGGRDLDRILDHVLGADSAYLSKIGWKGKMNTSGEWSERVSQVRQAILDELKIADRSGGLPLPGPRGGTRWLPRTFVRRVAWHALDHAWEIEDRMM
jgi:hypothetical protein